MSKININTFYFSFQPFWITFDSFTNSIFVVTVKYSLPPPYNWCILKIKASNGIILDVYNVSSNSASIVSDDTGFIWTIKDGEYLKKIKASDGSDLGNYSTGGNTGNNITNDGTSLWITDEGINSVIKMNFNGEVIGTYNVGSSPWNCSYDPYTDSIWIVNYGDSTLTKLKKSNGSFIGTYSAGSIGPYQSCFDNLTNSIWVAFYESNKVTKLDASTGSIIGSYDIDYPYGICFNKHRNSVWVTNADNNQIIELNPLNGYIIGIYDTGIYPSVPCFDYLTNSIWTCDNSGLTGSVTKLTEISDLTRFYSIPDGLGLSVKEFN